MSVKPLSLISPLKIFLDRKTAPPIVSNNRGAVLQGTDMFLRSLSMFFTSNQTDLHPSPSPKLLQSHG